MTKLVFEVDIQNDFMNKDGALYVPGAEDIKKNIEKLSHFAWSNDINMLGSLDMHTMSDSELDINCGPFPLHCMRNTIGMKRIEEAFDRGVNIPIFENNGPYCSNYEYEKFEQYGACLFSKQTYDVFSNKKIIQFIEHYGVDEVIIYGVATDYCVKAAVLGFQKHGVKCYVVNDAIKGVAKDTTTQAFHEMIESGASFINTKDALKMMEEWAE